MTGKTALIVIGMHRSGTSAVARLLSLAGGALPVNLLGIGAGNETGHWEPQRIIDYNGGVLAAFDAQWDSPFGLGMSASRRTVLDNYIEGAQKLIREEYADQRLIVLKEPRISLLVDLWIAACEAEQYKCKFVIMVRNPVEVAASLRRRNGMPFDQGLLLWGAYEASSVLLTRRHNRVFCRYEDVLTKPTSVLETVEATLELELPRLTAKAHSEMNAFVQPSMWHNNAQTLPGIPSHLERIRELADYIDLKMTGNEPIRDMSRIVQDWLGDLDQIVMPFIIGVREESVRAIAQSTEKLTNSIFQIEQLAANLSYVEAAHLAAKSCLSDTQDKMNLLIGDLDVLTACKTEYEEKNAVLRVEVEAAYEKARKREIELDCMRVALEAVRSNGATVPPVENWYWNCLRAGPIHLKKLRKMVGATLAR